MAKLMELGLTNEAVGQEIDYNDIPDQMGAFRDPPQPGSYRFRFPADLSAVWNTIDHPNGQPPGKRVQAKFDDSHPLTIIQSPGGVEDGNPFETSFSNAERRRGKKDDTSAPLVSDMDYILRDVFGVTQKPKTNVEYAQTFMKLAAGAEMGADVEWSWRCREDKNIRVDDGTGNLIEMDQKGCGRRYYEKLVEKVPSNPNDPNSPKVFPRIISCECGNQIRSFANLTRFRK